ncbi:hypothetical protein PI124_g1224 [Phytophthora idaei]|nr:hypothetical protein PI125_g7867 [Phytophthora idaei]KAG3146039.1 hypothetical protein PI126_g13489 [Phytophthora idaei]KAG3254221.1 hypothetical protein PI124_g1224 [Phytophthora idaei]
MEEQCLRSDVGDPAHYTGPYQHLCTLDENVFGLILSFLSNQALTKLHTATGDCYSNCEPHLTQFCCECGNDNPKILHNVCRECESKSGNYLPLADKEMATSVYGVKLRDLAEIPHYTSTGREDVTQYRRVDLENYLVAKYGSKLGWLREIACRDMVERKIQEMEQQEREEREAYMESLAPGFAIYAQLIDLEETNKSLLEQCSKRFAALTSALKSRGLQLRPTFKPCEQFIVAGDGNISDVVDTTEEMRFLDICTDYPRRCQWKVQSGHHGNKAICEEAKMELCIAYLENHRGLRLPRKWEDCRSRFEEVRRTRGIPQCEGRYIYSE